MYWGPEIQTLEWLHQEDVNSKKKELSPKTNQELSDLLKQYFSRADILASRRDSFEHSFRGKLARNLMFALMPAVVAAGLLEQELSKGVGYTFSMGLGMLGTAFYAMAKSPDDAEITSEEAEIGKDALIQLYAERHKIESKYVRSHLYEGK